MKRPYELRPSVRRCARERARRLVDAVVGLTEVPAEDILGWSSEPSIFRLRAACAWLIRRIDGLSYNEIGLTLGRLEHSTARYLVIRCDELRESDWPVRLLTDRILGENA